MSGHRTWLTAGAAAAGLLAIVAAGLVLARDAGSPAAPAVSRGSPAPELAGTDPITGKSVSLADFRGKPVVVNVWASWCPGCIDEAEDLRRFAAEHPEAAVLGIDLRDPVPDARAFYRRWRWQHPSIADPDGTLAARLGLVGMPTTYFLDPGHRIVASIVGVTDLQGFEDGLAKALAQA